MTTQAVILSEAKNLAKPSPPSVETRRLMQVEIGWKPIARQPDSSGFHLLSRRLDAALENEAVLQDIAAHTEDHREGVHAFVEKRAPQFRGK